MAGNTGAPKLTAYVEFDRRLSRAITERGFEDSAAGFQAVGAEHGFQSLATIRRRLNGDEFRLGCVLQSVQSEDTYVRSCIDDDAIGGPDRIHGAIENQPERRNVGLLPKFERPKWNFDLERKLSVKTDVSRGQPEPLARMFSAPQNFRKPVQIPGDLQQT
jgi:hypothetical protein